jgi:cytochrome P450
MYSTHRLESHWSDPFDFKPERWLESPEHVRKMKQAFIPFSSGVRACIARNLAWLELRVGLAAIIRNYEFTFVPGANMDPLQCFAFCPHDRKLEVTLQRREA